VLLDGPHLIAEALDSGIPLDVVVCADAAADDTCALVERAASAGARAVRVPSQVLAAMSPVTQPSGIVAAGRAGPVPLARVFGSGSDLVLLVQGVQDPGNLGAIIRTAEACGATGLIAGAGTADPFGWKALRGSMGSAFRLPIAADHLMTAIAAARASGLRVIATVPRGGTSLPKCDLRQPCAIVIGGEGSGLPDQVLETADDRLTIPMRAPVESLNVAVAAGLVLYEARRQRDESAPRRTQRTAAPRNRPNTRSAPLTAEHAENAE
jgi:TrmH family RNA methyltransferase